MTSRILAILLKLYAVILIGLIGAGLISTFPPVPIFEAWLVLLDWGLFGIVGTPILGMLLSHIIGVYCGGDFRKFPMTSLRFLRSVRVTPFKFLTATIFLTALYILATSLIILWDLWR